MNEIIQQSYSTRYQSFRLIPDQSHFATTPEIGTATNIPVSENDSATVVNNSIVSTGDLQHSASTGRGSSTFTSISYSFITIVSDKLSPTWVVDFGAPDHITTLSHLFISYSPCPNYKKK